MKPLVQQYLLLKKNYVDYYILVTWPKKFIVKKDGDIEPVPKVLTPKQQKILDTSNEAMDFLASKMSCEERYLAGIPRGVYMRAEAKALLKELLCHHRVVTKQDPLEKNLIISQYLIFYGVLCSRIGAPWLTLRIGSFLMEIAEWCAAMGYPALNALAVNHETGYPDSSYDGAGGFKLKDWDKEVERVIRFTSYPIDPPETIK